MGDNVRGLLGLPPSGGSHGAEWEVLILGDGTLLVKMPWRMLRPSSRRTSEEALPAWADVKVRIVSAIWERCTDPHTYVRLSTVRVPTSLLALAGECRMEMHKSKRRGESVVLIPNCQDKRVWKVMFEALTVEHEGKILFILNREPEDWRTLVERYHQIVSDTWRLRRRISDFDDELKECCLLSYSVMDDAALVIAKTELSEETVASILRAIAQEERLDLTITRDST